MKSRRNNWLALGGLAGLLFAGGFALGKIAPRESPQLAPEEVEMPAAVRIPTGSNSPAELPEVFHRLEGASGADFIKELERGLDGGFSGEMELFAFALRWVMEDAQGGADHLLSLIGEDEDSEQAERYYEAFEMLLFAWVKQDPDGLFAYAKKLEEQDHPMAEDFAEFVEEEAELGAAIEEATEFLSSIEPEDFDSKSSQVRRGIIQLAKSDPLAAAELLKKFPGIHRTNGIADLAREWAESDPIAALEWAGSLKGQGDRKIGLDTALRGIAQDDLATAKEYFRRFRKDLIGSSAANVILLQLGKDDPHGALLWYHEQIEGVGTGGMFDLGLYSQSSLITGMLPRGASDIREFLDAFPEGILKNGIEQSLAFNPRIDFKSDPGEFLAAFAEMPDDGLRTTLLSSGLRAWVELDARAVREAVDGMDGPLREVAARGILSVPGAFGSAAEAIAFARASGLDADTIGAAMNGTRKDWADLSSAAEFFSTATDVGPESGVAQFVAKWAEQSPEDALRWVEERPGETPELIAQVVSGWLQTDPEAASEWALTLEDPASRAASAETVAKAMRYKDPEASFAWALEVSDDSQREELLRHAYLGWKGRDASAADEALRGEGVPQELRDVFLEE